MKESTKTILLLGAGRSTTVLIDYLKKIALEGYKVIIADADLSIASQKAAGFIHVVPVQLSVNDSEKRKTLVAMADLVISMLPPAFHILVAEDCLQYNKHLLTASYIDEDIKQKASEIQQKGLLFLYEMGLDPGIDHMSAMDLIDRIKHSGGSINSFKSHCGGLVSPESDNNPWHYKVSWNTRNIVLAGKSGAIFKENGQEINLGYEQVFTNNRSVKLVSGETFGYYPNRNSLTYMAEYGLEDTATFIRTTLRHPDFITGWKSLVDLKLTDESVVYNTDHLTFAEFFVLHSKKFGLSNWLHKQLSTSLRLAKDIGKTMAITSKLGETRNNDDRIVMGSGQIPSSTKFDDKAGLPENEPEQEGAILRQLIYLGFDSNDLINAGKKTAAEILQIMLEKKLALQPNDKDLVVMVHEIGYTHGDDNYLITSELKQIGNNANETAMAKTVGLPLGIAARMILEGKITTIGLQRPTIKHIYEPVLNALKLHQVIFSETIYKL